MKLIKDISVWGKSEKLLYQGDLLELPIAEELVLAKCREFFNDDEPCFVHRSIVSCRIFSEMEDYLNELHLVNGDIFFGDELAQPIKAIFSEHWQVQSISVVWESQ